MKKIKVLYFVDRMLRGGIQSFILEYLQRFDRNRVQVDLLLLDDGKQYELETVLRNMGITIYKLNGIWLGNAFGFPDYIKALREFYKVHHDYKAVHVHSGSKNFPVLMYAKKYCIPMRIAHSHNTMFQDKNKMAVLLGNLFKIPLRYYATDYFACSKQAGEWLFGKKNVKKGNVRMIHNAIDLQRFKYDEAVRAEIRKELDLEDKLVLGNVGRFSIQKNHSFLIDIFSEVYSRNRNTVLVLVGEGELKQTMVEKTEQLGLTEAVRFLGFREDRERILQAMDLFIMPSFFEGLGIVLVEAQATGVAAVVSDTIPREAYLTDHVTPMSLHCLAKEWADTILKIWRTHQRKDMSDMIAQKGYDIVESAKMLEKLYLNE